MGGEGAGGEGAGREAKVTRIAVVVIVFSYIA